MFKRTHTYNTLLLMLMAGMIAGQSPDTTSIETENVEVLKNYEAIIQQAKRKNIESEVPQINKQSFDYSYNLKSESRLDFERPKEIIRPVTYSPPRRKTDIKDGSFYAGYGNYKTLALGGAYHYYIEDWLDLGFKADHFSADDNALPHQKYNSTDILAYGSYFLGKKTKAGAEVRYRKFDHFTPVNIGTDSLAAIEQPFNSIGGAFKLSSNAFESAGLSFRTRIEYDRLNQTADDSHENLFRAELNILKKINDVLALELPAEFRSHAFSSIDTSRSSDVKDIILRPNLRLRNDAYSVKAGIEYIKSDSSSFIFPIVDIRIENIYSDVALRLYTSSRYDRNSMHYLSDIDPYYLTGITPMTVNYFRSYNLELGRRMLDWNFRFTASYNDYVGDDMHVDRANNRPIIFSLDREEWRLNPAVNYTSEMFEIDLSYTYNIFTGGSKNNLFYRPKSSFRLALTENIIDGRLRLGQELSYVSARNTAHPSDDDGMLESFWELGLSLDLKVVDSVDIFLKASNVLGTEYSIWYNHPVLTRQIWGGIRFRI